MGGKKAGGPKKYMRYARLLNNRLACRSLRSTRYSIYSVSVFCLRHWVPLTSLRLSICWPVLAFCCCCWPPTCSPTASISFTLTRSFELQFHFLGLSSYHCPIWTALERSCLSTIPSQPFGQVLDLPPFLQRAASYTVPSILNTKRHRHLFLRRHCPRCATNSVLLREQDDTPPNCRSNEILKHRPRSDPDMVALHPLN